MAIYRSFKDYNDLSKRELIFKEWLAIKNGHEEVFELNDCLKCYENCLETRTELSWTSHIVTTGNSGPILVKQENVITQYFCELDEITVSHVVLLTVIGWSPVHLHKVNVWADRIIRCRCDVGRGPWDVSWNAQRHVLSLGMLRDTVSWNAQRHCLLEWIHI